MNKINSVLLIDDDEEDKIFFREALLEVAAHVQCLEASNGQHALHMLNAPDAVLPDLIFLDLNMPIMDGKQFLQSIVISKNLCHIPVIIYTTTGQEQDIQETRKMGAAHFITKPIYFEDICQAISDTLQRNWDDHRQMDFPKPH